MPIKCIQWLHLGGSHWCERCLGAFKGQTWKQHGNPQVESHLSCKSVSPDILCPPLAAGQGSQKRHWPHTTGGRDGIELLLSPAGQQGLRLVGFTGRPFRERCEGCVPPDRAGDVQGTGQNQSPQFWTVLQALLLRPAGLPKCHKAGRVQHCSLRAHLELGRCLSGSPW